MAFLFAMIGACAIGRSEDTEIVIPLDDGEIVLRKLAFIQSDGQGSTSPKLTFRVMNGTSETWRRIELVFQIAGGCSGKARQWEVAAHFPLSRIDDDPVSNYEDTVVPLIGQVDGCTSKLFRAALVSAESLPTKAHDALKIDARPGERIDLTVELQKQLDAEAVESARKAKEAAQRAKAESKIKAAEAAHQRRINEERKNREAEQQVRLDAIRAEETAKAAQERAKVRAACASIYQCIRRHEDKGPDRP